MVSTPESRPPGVLYPPVAEQAKPPPLGDQGARRSPRVAFLYTWGRLSRLSSLREVPSDFFYGGLELRDRGWNIDMLEEEELGIRPPRAAVRWLGRSLQRALEANPARIARLARPSALRRLNQYDAIVATNQHTAVDISALRSAGLLRPHLLALIMGLIPLPPRGAREAFMLRRLLRRTTVTAISKGEQDYVRRRLGSGVDVRYVPFGVDHHFWRPGARDDASPYVISVGNDGNRDFDLLVRTWKPEWPELRIITRRTIDSSKPNINVIRGDYRDEIMTDAAMRQHVQGAMFAIVPVRDTAQPSGQSAGLQAMACGIPLVISNIVGIWDRDIMRHGATCLLPAAGSETAMAECVAQLLASPALRESLGQAARAAVETHFNAQLMGDELGKLITELCATQASPNLRARL